MESKKKIYKHTKILIGISGSVASIKLRELVKKLLENFDASICIIPTQNSLHFVPDFDAFNEQIPLLKDRLNYLKTTDSTKNIVFGFTDSDEWSSWQKRSDPVLHIELKKWADIMLIAPLDANTMAKLANGICDNLLTCIARAWDMSQMKTKPIIICPAMNTYMFEHPLTNKQIRILTEDLNYTMIDCVEKLLMCGDIGNGAMASIDTIITTVSDILNRI